MCPPGFAGERCEINISTGLEDAIQDIIDNARDVITTFSQGSERDTELNNFLDAISNMQVTIVAQQINERSAGLTQIEIAQTTKKVMEELKQPISKQDLPQKTKQIVLTTSAITSVFLEPVLISAPPMRSNDTCASGLGQNCPIMLVVDEIVVIEGKQELRIMEAASEAGSWALSFENPENPQLLAKQTRLETGKKKYLMQCWDNGWTKDEIYNTSTGASTYECNGHVLLVASMAGICTPSTCQNGGSCNAIGAAFLCNCPAGFTGATCEVAQVVNHCSLFDCDQAGGLGNFATPADAICSVSDPCTYLKCCETDPATFYSFCDTFAALGDAQLYLDFHCCAACSPL